MTELTDQEIVRKEKLTKLRSSAYPYPNDVCVTATSETIKQQSAVDNSNNVPEKSRPRFTVAGRIMSLRLMGKAAFFHIQDRKGLLQIYIRTDDVGEETFGQFKSFDIGDIVAVNGYSFITKTGEPSLHAQDCRLLVKCLHPLPEKWHGLTDVEIRYRQRYLDLIVNPAVQDVFRKRSQIIAEIHRFFDERDYIEVETPVMSTVASGAMARPFTTHHNVLNLDLHLRIALELPLKRLVVGGLERVYEIGRIFRNEGISTEHNPEFTMIEFYQAYADYNDLMALTEELISGLCEKVNSQSVVSYKGKDINFSRPWARYTIIEAIHHFAGIDKKCDLTTLDGVHAAAKILKCDDLLEQKDYGIALYELFDRNVEAKIVNPTFITQFPLSVSPLARPNISDSRFVDRFELIVAGMELANAFSELNDPEDQKTRLLAQVEAQKKGDDEAMTYDDDFVKALEYGLAPTAGEGIGIDRLVMLLTGCESIRDVILFPTMRPL